MTEATGGARSEGDVRQGDASGRARLEAPSRGVSALSRRHEEAAVRGSTTPHAVPGKGLGYVLAKSIGYALNPLIFPPVLAALLLLHFGAPGVEVWTVTALFVLFFALLPLAHLLWLLRRRAILSLEIENRHNRRAPMLGFLGMHIGAILLIPAAGSTIPAFVAALIACQFVNAAIIAGITPRWKISIHAAAIGGFVGTLLFVSYVEWPVPSGAPVPSLLQFGGVVYLLPLVPLLMWARVRAGIHTVPQVLAGAALGVVLSVFELALLHRLGMLP